MNTRRLVCSVPLGPVPVEVVVLGTDAPGQIGRTVELLRQGLEPVLVRAGRQLAGPVRHECPKGVTTSRTVVLAGQKIHSSDLKKY